MFEHSSAALCKLTQITGTPTFVLSSLGPESIALMIVSLFVDQRSSVEMTIEPNAVRFDYDYSYLGKTGHSLPRSSPAHGETSSLSFVRMDLRYPSPVAGKKT